MDGITILSETLENGSVTGGIVLIILGAISAIMAILLLIFVIKEDYPQMSVFIVMLVAVSIFSIIYGITKLNKEPYTKYKVTIDKNVSLVEFNEKYEILNQEGLIYEIKERTDD